MMIVIRILLWLIFLTMTIGGIFSLFFDLTFSYAPLILMTSGFCITLFSSKNKKSFMVILLLIIFGVSIENIGVIYGVPFGSYVYSDYLGIKLLHTPVAIGFAWVMLTILASSFLNHNISLKNLFLGAFILTSFDLIIDPVSVNVMGAWEWESSGIYYGIPLSNFIGWFLTSILAMIILLIFKPKISYFGNLPGIIILTFFWIISITEGMIIPSILGLILIVYFLIKNSRSLFKKTF